MTKAMQLWAAGNPSPAAFEAIVAGYLQVERADILETAATYVLCDDDPGGALAPTIRHRLDELASEVACAMDEDEGPLYHWVEANWQALTREIALDLECEFGEMHGRRER